MNESVPISPVTKSSRIGAGEAAQHFSFSQSGDVYTFEWATEVLHYLLNEYYGSALPLANPTPWHSIAAGDAAFQDYADKVLPTRLPDADKFITTQVVTLT